MPWFFGPTVLAWFLIRSRSAVGAVPMQLRGTMSRRDGYIDAMARKLGAARYRALHGGGSAAEAA
jgi:hypothetical protein